MKNSKFDSISFTLSQKNPAMGKFESGLISFSASIKPNENISEEDLEHDIRELKLKVKAQLELELVKK